MEERRWEEMCTDCLVEIFSRTGMMSLLLDVPLVCKSWYEASRHPKCWQNLVFPEIRFSHPPPHDDHPVLKRFLDKFSLKNCENFPTASFLSFLLNHNAARSVSKLVLPGSCSAEALGVVSNECPELKFLGLSSDLLYRNGRTVKGLVKNWRNLQVLMVGYCHLLSEILSEVRLHCKKFAGLICCSCWIGEDEALGIASSTQLRYLSFRNAHLRKKHLLMILQGCRSLELLEFKDCRGFDSDDDEIKRLISRIRIFKFKKSADVSLDPISFSPEEQSSMMDRDFLSISFDHHT